ncbi:MAG: PAS domain-containing protein [Oligoflexales bacterium]|nr:PAS domain-containing protein [Oligoflexales bacterium]
MVKSSKLDRKYSGSTSEAELLDGFQSLARIGAWELKLDQKMVLVSRGVCKLFEIPECQAITTERFLQFFVPPDRQRLEECFKGSFNQGIRFSEDFELQKEAGEKVWVKWTPLSRPKIALYK